jgi:iron complex outermembrane receptor protein
VDVSAFYNDLESVEAHAPFVEIVPPLFRVVLYVLFRNLVKGNTKGVEVVPTWTLKSWWQLKDSYSHIQLDLANKPDGVDGSTAKSIEGSSPHHQVVFQSLTQLPRNLQLDLTLRFISALPAQSVGAYPTGDVRLG